MFLLLLLLPKGKQNWKRCSVIQLAWLYARVNCYTAVGRYGHSAVLMENSIYFYGGDSSITASTRTPLWLSDLAVLNMSTSFSLQQPNWSPVSGTQSILGGPSVYYHVGFTGTRDSRQMFIMGGITPSSQSQPDSQAYVYDTNRRLWTSLSLPNKDNLFRQGAAASVTSNGQAYLWGGKPITGEIFMNASAVPQDGNLMYRLNSSSPESSAPVVIDGTQSPNMRYSHSQTIVNDSKIIVLGGFDGVSGTPTSLGDIWIFDIISSTWANIQATLNSDGRPDARSSHSAVLMPDGKSIVIYGGYDGYNVFNDVAVLNTDTWTWEVKNTTANVQGRADHTATIVGNNMIVAFGFTGVSTSLSILSDIENLDVTTWSWRSVYNTSSDAAKGSTGEMAVAGPTPGVIIGAVASIAALFCILLIALHICNRRYHSKHNEDEYSIDKETNSLQEAYSITDQDDPMYGEILSSTSGTTIAPITLARRGGQRVKRSFSYNGDRSTSPSSFHRFFSASNMNDLPHSKKDSLESYGDIMPPHSPLEDLQTVEAKVPQIIHIGKQPTGMVAATAKMDRPHSTFDGEEFIVLGGGDERMMSPVSEKSISLGVETLVNTPKPQTDAVQEGMTTSTAKGKERAHEQSNQGSNTTDAEHQI